MSEAEEILRINPKYHPASHGLASQLLRDAEISWDIGESDRALANLDRAEAILRQLVASYPELTSYRSDLATTIRVHVRMDSEIGRDHDDEPRLREAMALAESALRDDPNPVMNLPDTAAVVFRPGDHARPARSACRGANSLFGRCPRSARTRRGRDPRGMSESAVCLPGHWRPAPSSWGGSDRFENRSQTGIERWHWPRTLMSSRSVSVRATTVSFSSDYRAALLETAEADRSIDDRANLRLTSALAHAVLVRRHPPRSIPDCGCAALGSATQLAAALEQIGQARRSLAYRDVRRLYHRLGDHDFDPLREQPAFQILLMDLAFPARPFAARD